MARVTHLRDSGGNCAPQCYGCKLEGFTVQPSAMGTRNPGAARAAKTDPQLEKDRDAYKALRRNGEQPKHVGGSAYLQAHAEESFEITTGRLISDDADRKQLAKGFEEMPAGVRVRTSPDQEPIHAS